MVPAGRENTKRIGKRIMKFKVSRSVLADGLKKVQNAVPGKPVLQILANVKIEATADGRLVLSASDLDMTVQTAVKCEVEEAGATTLPAKLLLNAVQKLPEWNVELDSDPSTEKATIKGGSAVYRLNGLSARDFPTADKVQVVASYTLTQPLLRECIRKTAFACSDDDTRKNLKGINVEYGGGKLTLAATDGRRLALVESDAVADKTADKGSVIITQALAGELLRLLESEGDVRISIAKEKIAFAIGQTVITSKLLDGAFPNYRQVIPDMEKMGYTTISIDRAMLIGAIDRANVVATSGSESVRLTFAANELIVSSTAADESGEARDVVPVKYDGAQVEILFMAPYVLEPLKAIDDDEIAFCVADGAKPAVIKCTSPYICVVMPLRTA